ncbi:hypothetical protein DL767_001392 [Monosporascus sp. MG133]|nr:hypothetical protein DL767_001392 [Monosporascus sp. MG133]
MTAHVLRSTTTAKLLAFRCWAHQDEYQLPAELTKSPQGFPKTVKSPMAWTGTTLKDEDLRRLELDEQDVHEIEAALAYFRSLELKGDEVNKERFPLPTTASASA